MKALRNVLLINALTSGVTGLALAVIPGIFASLFETPARAPFVGTGVFLIVYAVIVFMESRRPELSAPWIRFIILMDTLWVVCSLIIIASGIFTISVLGYGMIAAVALWVGLMGYLQYAGLKKMLSASGV